MGIKRHLSLEYTASADVIVELPDGVRWEDIEWCVRYNVFHWTDKTKEGGPVNEILLNKDICIGDTKRPLGVEVYFVGDDGEMTWEEDDCGST